MPAKGTGGKHRQPKAKSKEVKQWVKRSGTRTGPGTVKAAQDKAEKAVIAKAKANRDTTQKIYDAESMFTREKAILLQKVRDLRDLILLKLRLHQLVKNKDKY